MSHYCVLVQTKTDKNLEKRIESAMKPFFETCNKKSRYTVFEDCTESVIKGFNELSEEEKEEYGSVYIYNDRYTQYDEKTVEENGKYVTKYGYYYNPNAKWDWYEIGGRWNNSIPTIQGENVNTCKVKDINFEIDVKEYNRAIKFWEIYVEKTEEERTQEEKDFVKFTFYTPKYYLETYKTKEEYAERTASLSFYGVLTLDGKWLEQGPMGWFGVSDTSTEDKEKWDKSFKSLIESLDQESYVTVVDCHI